MARPGVNEGGMMPPGDVLRGVVAKLRAFSPLTRNRGQDYARDGRVGRLIFEDDTVRAKVHGTEIYDVVWAWGTSGASARRAAPAPWPRTASMPTRWRAACWRLPKRSTISRMFGSRTSCRPVSSGRRPTVVPIAAGVAPTERRRDPAARPSGPGAGGAIRRARAAAFRTGGLAARARARTACSPAGRRGA